MAMHRLCLLLNELGYEAFLTRQPKGIPAYRDNLFHVLFRILLWKAQAFFLSYRTLPSLQNRIITHSKKPFDKNWIVVYPEIVFGNPLDARNVVRWLLHRPGFHSGHIFFGSGEFLIDFNEFAVDYFHHGSYKSPLKLHVLSIPFDLYNTRDALPSEKRKGTAYCMRKGKGRRIEHDLTDSVLIDDMPHDEVAKILKRVKTFISYDTYTAYSWFATLCGAESIVVPEPGLSKEQWHADPLERLGIAYGFDDLTWAKETSSLLLEQLQTKERQMLDCVRAFAEEALLYFEHNKAQASTEEENKQAGKTWRSTKSIC